MISSQQPAPPTPSGGRRVEDDDTTSKSRQDTLHDARLVERFKAGEHQVFDEIVERHRSRLFSAAYVIIRNSDDAEEIAQDAFVCAHRNLATFRGDCALATWLYRITQNLARNRYWYFHRRQRHSTLSLNHALNEDQTGTLLDLVPCDSGGPLQEIVTREFTDLIAECMRRMGERQKTILTLTHTLSYPEIAARMGIHVGTVKSRIARARASLRALLIEACPEFGRGARPEAWFEPAPRRDAHDLRAA